MLDRTAVANKNGFRSFLDRLDVLKATARG